MKRALSNIILLLFVAQIFSGILWANDKKIEGKSGIEPVPKYIESVDNPSLTRATSYENDDLGGSWFDDFDDEGGIGWSNNVTLSLGKIRFRRNNITGFLVSISITLPESTDWDTFSLTKNEPLNAFINVSIINASSNITIPGFGNLTSRNIDISNITAESICLKAYFSRDGEYTPWLDSWGVEWTAENAWRDGFVGDGKCIYPVDVDENVTGYWKFDDGNDNYIKDWSGNGVNGNLQGAKWCDGKRGKGLEFDGNDDFVTAGNNNDVQFGVEPFTLEAWIKPYSYQNGMIVSKRHDSGSAGVGKAKVTWKLDATGYLKASIADNSGDSTTHMIDDKIPISINTWNHVIFIRENLSKWTFYVNGLKGSTFSNLKGNMSSSRMPIYIGIHHYGSTWNNKFHGIIDEVRISNVARTPEEIRKAYQAGLSLYNGGVEFAENELMPEQNTSALWHFNEAVGNKTYDASGNVNDGIIYGANWTEGIVDNAMKFDGIDDYVVIEKHPLEGISTFTIGAWIRPENVSTSQVIISNEVDGEMYINIETNGTLSFWVRLTGPQTWYIVYTQIVNQDQWYYVSATFENATDTQKIYLNGVLNEQKTASSDGSYNLTQTGSSRNIHIGSDFVGTTNYEGIVDEVAIYNRSLNASEIQAHANRYPRNTTFHSVPISLPNGHSWDQLVINKTVPTNSYLNISILDNATHTTIPGFVNIQSNGIVNISSINGSTYPHIRLNASIVGNGSNTPILHSWAVNWTDTDDPVANAGGDQTVNQTDFVTFDGTSSIDNIAVTNYTWTFTDGGAQTLYGSGPTYNFNNAGVFTVTLTAKDAAGNTQTDTMTVTVNDTDNPVAIAGFDQTVDQGDQVTFDGTGSTDNVGVDNYTWTFTDGGGHTLYGSSPTYTFDNAGPFTVTLTVNDAAGNNHTDPMTVTVNDTTNPIADAGDDQTVDQGDQVTFDGMSSTDNVGVDNYTWTFTDGGDHTLYGSTPTYTFNNAGAFTVTLTIKDAACNEHTDTMKVTVNDTEKPNANAGNSLTVNQGTLVTFDGRSSSDNIGVTNYTWTFTDGGTQTLYGTSPSFTFYNSNVITVTLNITDAAGNWDTDSITVTVKDTENPIANAGNDQSADQGDLITFDGTGSTDNVGVDNYMWTYTDGGAQTLYGSGPTYTFDNAGAFTVALTIKDAAGNEQTDTMTVTINDKEPPNASAGNSLTVNQGTYVIFDGSSSSDNVGITNYMWSFNDSGMIVLLGITPGYTFYNPGVFNVTLNVSDTVGNWNDGSMIVTVRDSEDPMASAGDDLIRDQGDAVTLNARGSTDNVLIVNYTWSFQYDGIVTLYGNEVTHVFFNAGAFTVTLRVLDQAGNSDTDTLVVTVNDTTAPKAKAGGDFSIAQGTEIFLNGMNSTDNIGIVSYEWSFIEGGRIKLLYRDYVRHTFLEAGKFNITLVVKDAQGNRHSTVIAVTVLDSEKPIADAGEDLKIYKGRTVTLDGNNSKDNVAVTDYSWSFIDRIETQLSGFNPNYTFNNIGTYTITLTVSDIMGNYAVDRVIIVVEDTMNHEMFTTVKESVSEEDKQKIHLTFSKSMLEEYVVEQVEIDFGDGHCEIITLSEYSNDEIITLDHRYAKEGDYIISVKAIEENGYAYVTKKAVSIEKQEEELLSPTMLILLSNILIILIFLIILTTVFYKMKQVKRTLDDIQSVKWEVGPVNETICSLCGEETFDGGEICSNCGYESDDVKSEEVLVSLDNIQELGSFEDESSEDDWEWSDEASDDIEPENTAQKEDNQVKENYVKDDIKSSDHKATKIKVKMKPLSGKSSSRINPMEEEEEESVFEKKSISEDGEYVGIEGEELEWMDPDEEDFNETKSTETIEEEAPSTGKENHGVEQVKEGDETAPDDEIIEIAAVGKEKDETVAKNDQTIIEEENNTNKYQREMEKTGKEKGMELAEEEFDEVKEENIDERDRKKAEITKQQDKTKVKGKSDKRKKGRQDDDNEHKKVESRSIGRTKDDTVVADKGDEVTEDDTDLNTIFDDLFGDDDNDEGIVADDIKKEDDDIKRRNKKSPKNAPKNDSKKSSTKSVKIKKRVVHVIKEKVNDDPERLQKELIKQLVEGQLSIDEYKKLRGNVG